MDIGALRTRIYTISKSPPLPEFAQTRQLPRLQPPPPLVCGTVIPDALLTETVKEPIELDPSLRKIVWCILPAVITIAVLFLTCPSVLRQSTFSCDDNDEYKRPPSTDPSYLPHPPLCWMRIAFVFMAVCVVSFLVQRVSGKR